MRKPIDAPLYARLCTHYGVQDPGDLPARIVRILSQHPSSSVDLTMLMLVTARTRLLTRRNRRGQQTQTPHRGFFGTGTGEHQPKPRHFSIPGRSRSPSRKLVHQYARRRYP